MGHWWSYLLASFFSIGGKGKGTLPHSPSGGGDVINSTGTKNGSGDNESGRLYNLSESDRLLDNNGDTLDHDSDSIRVQQPVPRLNVPNRISRYITYREATKSNTAIRHGIANIPTEAQLFVMRYMGTHFFDPLREHFKVPIYISSFFRSKILNAKVGGSDESHHMIKSDICAIDMDMDGHGKPTNKELFNYIKDNTNYYMLIWEFGNDLSPAWVHVSYSSDEKKNQQKHVYRAIKQNNKTIYVRF